MTTKIKTKKKTTKKVDEQNKKTIEKTDPERPPDIMQEQLEDSQVTSHCPESVTENDLSKVKKNPENYIEINMINKNRMVDCFYIYFTKKSFKYRTKKYNVDEERIFLLPNRSGLLTLTCFFKEGIDKAKDFKQLNKGITSKALSILYNPRLYEELLVSENKLYNFFIAVFSIIILIVNCVSFYFLFRGSF